MLWLTHCFVSRASGKGVRHEHADRSSLTFNEDLLAQNGSFQEYVIVHELLHLRVPNHGKLFRSLMALYLPDGEPIEGANPDKQNPYSPYSPNHE